MAAAPHATEMIRSGATPLDMLQTAVGRTDLEVLETRRVQFACLCSPERALQIVGGLGRDIIEDMVGKSTGEEIVCHVCNERYFIDVDTIRGLLVDEG
jgi:molecular chaperone Hsp33